MKRLIVIGIIILLVGVSIPSTGINVENSSLNSFNGKTLYVGGSGPGNYTKIQDAIDNSSYSDTVFVYNGTYIENLKIDNSVTLIGENKETTIIDGGGIGTVIFIDDYSWCIIKEFTIRNCGEMAYDAGIYIESNSDSNIIAGNNIINNKNNGIFLDSSENNLISENVIENNSEYGIFMDWSFYNWINDNYISENKEGGIFVGSSEIPTKNIEPTYYEFYNDISGNIITHNLKSGIHLCLTCDNDIFNNNISYNTKGVYIEAPFLTATCGNNISKNNIMNNEYGVAISIVIMLPFFQKLSRASNNSIYRNNFIGNKKNALNNDKNVWDGNYWDDWIGLRFRILRFLPYIITIGLNSLAIDRHPASEPYDIGV